MKFQIVNQILSKSFPGGKRFLSKPRENENDENEILYFLQNLERNLSQKYFSKKFFFFSWRNIFESCLQILENPKNFMISFFHPLNLSGVVLGENLSSLLSKGLSGKSVLITFISSGLRRKLFLPFILKLLPIQSQINHNPINRFH